MKHAAFLSLISLLFLAVVPASAEEKEPAGHLYSTIQVNEKATDEIVNQAIVKAAIGRRWNIVSDEEWVIITLKHRGYDSTLTFVYDDETIKIYSDSYVVNKRGERKKQKDPAGWIGNLEKDIGVFINQQLYL